MQIIHLQTKWSSWFSSSIAILGSYSIKHQPLINIKLGCSEAKRVEMYLISIFMVNSQKLQQQQLIIFIVYYKIISVHVLKTSLCGALVAPQSSTHSKFEHSNQHWSYFTCVSILLSIACEADTLAAILDRLLVTPVLPGRGGLLVVAEGTLLPAFIFDFCQ